MRQSHLLSIVLVCAITAFASISRAAAQDPEPTPQPRPKPVPIVIVNVASAQRVLSDVTWTFETAKRPDMLDLVGGFLSRIGDLKGVERTKPLGVMLFLPQTLPPQPIPVGFFPVASLQDLLKMLEDGPFTVRKLDASDRYELQGRGGNTIHARLRDGYALLSSDEDILDADLPEIATTVAPLATRYDVAATFRIQSIPGLIREVFLGYLRMQSEAELQRRDDEPQSAYLMRRANGISTLEFLDRLLREGETITVGWDASQELKKGVLEINVEATPDSEFSKYLKELNGRSTMFSALYSEDEPMTLSASWLMEKREKKAALEWVKVLETELTRLLSSTTEGPHPAVSALVEPLRTTMEDGHFDVCVQYKSPDPERFVLIGGLRIVGSEALASGLRQTLQEFKGVEGWESAQLDVDSHQGVSFHKLVGRYERPNEELLYGGKPGVYLGSGQRAFWFAVGTDEALTALKRSMDSVLAGSAGEIAGRAAPFQVVFRVSPWLRLSPPPEAGDGAQRRSELAKEAFNKQSDAVRIEVRPTDTGLRLRVALDESFIRLLGLALARRYDESQL